MSTEEIRREFAVSNEIAGLVNDARDGKLAEVENGDVQAMVEAVTRKVIQLAQSDEAVLAYFRSLRP